MEEKILLEKLQYESARVEDMIFAYAKRNGFTDYLNKWNNKPFSDADHTLYHFVGELLDEIDKKDVRKPGMDKG